MKIVRIYDILGCRVTQVSKWVAGLDLGQSKLGTSDAWLIRQSTQHIILKIVRFAEQRPSPERIGNFLSPLKFNWTTSVTNIQN